MKEMLDRDFIENFIKYHKKTIIKVFAGFIFFAAAFFVFCIRDSGNSEDTFQLTETMTDVNSTNKTGNMESMKDSSDVQDNEDESDNIKESVIYVDVSGAVKLPYVYELPTGSRVFEAIEIAGGLTEKADTSTLNLAQVLLDQDKLTVPIIDAIKSDSTEKGIVNRQSIGVANSVENSMRANQSSADGLININTATSAELQTITGIGPATAEKIILYRQEQGKFEKIEDIMKVSGIGEKTYTKFKTKIMV